MPGTTAWEAETTKVRLVAIQARAAAEAAATASPTAGVAAAAITAPVITAEALPAPKDTGSDTRQGQPRSARSARLRQGTR